MDLVEQRLRELNERVLLHVAAIRAVKTFYVSSYGISNQILSA